MNLNVKNAGIALKNYRSGKRLRTMWSVLSARVLQLKYGQRGPFTSKAAAGCPLINKMEINIAMQGWFAVIVGDRCVAAFVEYEDAMRFKKSLIDSLEAAAEDIYVERITHRRG